MKVKDLEKLKKARNVINLLLEGIDPVSYEKIDNDSFINSPKIIRTLSYLALVLSQDIKEVDIEKNISNPSIKNYAIPLNSNVDYKSINEKIKLSKIEVFNKVLEKSEKRKNSEHN